MIELPEPYGYENTYIHLKVPMPDGLPALARVNGYSLLLKSEFHICFVKTGYAAELIDKESQEQIQDEILKMFCEFIQRQPLDVYRWTNQFRFVERDERKTLIGMVSVPHLAEFFEELREQYNVDIPYHPTHITMYTLQPEKGIGITSSQQMQDISQPVEVPELADIQLIPAPE